jgi:hypothetical protein
VELTRAGSAATSICCWMVAIGASDLGIAERRECVDREYPPA